MSDQPPGAREFKIEFPPDLQALYANFAIITHSPSEFIIDFAQVLPNTPKARVGIRIVTTPTHAKLLLQALQRNLERYESRFGEIRMPSAGDELVRQFFGGVTPPEE